MKKLVYAADSTAVTSSDYDQVMDKAVTAFLTHAEEEESQQFATLKSKLSAEDNDVRLSALLLCWMKGH